MRPGLRPTGRPSSWREPAGHSLRRWAVPVLGTALLLAVVALRVDGESVRLAAKRADGRLVLSGLSLIWLAPLVSAARTWALFRGLSRGITFARALAVNLESIAYSVVLPGDLVAGLIRWARLAAICGGRLRALGLMLLERTLDVAILIGLVIVAPPSVAAIVRETQAFVGRSSTLLMLLALSAAVFAVGVPWLRRRRSSSALPSPFDSLNRLRLEVRRREGSRVLVGVAATLGASVAFWAVYCVGGLLLTRSMLAQMPILPFFGSLAIVVLLGQLPISFGGLGVRELSLPVLLGVHGLTPEIGLLVGLALFVSNIPLAIAGLVATRSWAAPWILEAR